MCRDEASSSPKLGPEEISTPEGQGRLVVTSLQRADVASAMARAELFEPDWKQNPHLPKNRVLKVLDLWSLVEMKIFLTIKIYVDRNKG